MKKEKNGSYKKENCRLNNINQVENNLDNQNKKQKQTLYIVIIIALVVLITETFITIGNMRRVENDYVSATLAKPIIYLYPEEETELTVNLGRPEIISCSYPKYNSENGWNIIAKPDGTLIDKDTNRALYSLYWEGEDSVYISIEDGFVVKGEDTIVFLEEKLAILGLNERESEEFIVYWLPKLERNKYNYIRFATIDEINEMMPLDFSVQPDTTIRVLMEFKPLNEYIEVQEQELTTPNRTGFVVVEWGGMEIK